MDIRFARFLPAIDHQQQAFHRKLFGHAGADDRVGLDDKSDTASPRAPPPRKAKPKRIARRVLKNDDPTDIDDLDLIIAAVDTELGSIWPASLASDLLRQKTHGQHAVASCFLWL